MSVTRQTVYFVVASTPSGDKRMGPAYPKRATAQSWAGFVRKANRNVYRVRVLACRLRWVDGKLDAESITRLDGFNMDPPSAQG
jgi:hypothetical protein